MTIHRTRETIQVTLDRAGLSTAVHASAEAFVASFDTSPSGCLVVDQNLPGMSGLELQQFLVDRGIVMTTVMITGQGSVRTAVNAMKAGAIDVLEKPVAMPMLLQRVRLALERFEQRQRVEEERRGAARRLAGLAAQARSDGPAGLESFDQAHRRRLGDQSQNGCRPSGACHGQAR